MKGEGAQGLRKEAFCFDSGSAMASRGGEFSLRYRRIY